MRIEVVNQHDELVLSYDQALLMSGSVQDDGNPS
jgi:hypothetical protein